MENLKIEKVKRKVGEKTYYNYVLVYGALRVCVKNTFKDDYKVLDTLVKITK